MKSARINIEFNGDAGPRQTGGVGDVFINEEVERRAGDKGRRQATKVGGSRGGSVGRHIWAARLVAQERGPAEAIVVRRPDEFAGDWVGLSRNACAVIEHWIDQMLKRQLVFAAITREQSERCCEAAASALAHHADAVAINAEFGSVRECPGKARVAILDTRRERMLRRE